MKDKKQSGIRVLATLQKGGLANRLFPWARATIFSLLNDYDMLQVAWSQAKIGPILRGERDRRLYLNIMCQHPRYIKGPRRLLHLATDDRLTEPLCLSKRLSDARGLVVFTGLEDLFRRLGGHHDMLREELLMVTRPIHHPQRGRTTPIVAHIRRSDFDERATPLSWFEEMILSLRASGVTEEVGIVTDGTAREVSTLLNIQGVKLIRTGSAIGDLWVASSAAVLLGSEHSTFSCWASFLGQSVTAFRPNGDMLGLQDVNNSFVGAVNPVDQSGEFASAAIAALLVGKFR